MAINPNDLGNTATLTFADDFNSLSLWNGQSGTWNTGDSWGNLKGFSLSGNGEEQWYINSQYAPTQSVTPWTVSNGVLNITAAPASDAIKQEIGGYDYTSGQVNTFHSFSQTYGYFEMRAQLPAGQGLWPAFWLLPEDNSWPPEIDVMENLGNNMKEYAATVHTAETGSHTQTSAGVDTPDLSAGFHNYGVDWEADKITWYFDGKQVFQADTPSDMNKPAYMVANLAVGGYWPGSPDASTHFPATMKIDYIHAFSAKPDGEATPAPTPTHSDPSTPTDPTHAASGSTDQPTTTDPVETPHASAPQDPTQETAAPPVVVVNEPASDTPGANAPTDSAGAPSSDTPVASAPEASPVEVSQPETPTASSPSEAAPSGGGATTPPSVTAPAQTADASAGASDQFDFSHIGAHRGGHHGHANAHHHDDSHAFANFDWMGGSGARGGCGGSASQAKVAASFDDHHLGDLADASAAAHADAGWHHQQHGHHFFG